LQGIAPSIGDERVKTPIHRKMGVYSLTLPHLVLDRGVIYNIQSHATKRVVCLETVVGYNFYEI